MIKHIGAFAAGFGFAALLFWLGGADFTERGSELQYEFFMCSLSGCVSICTYKVNTM